MPARLVYSPKTYVFTKNSRGEVLNLTEYVVSGRVQRLVNQPSTAEVTLRNPKKRFTIPKSPAFIPMDTITIWLERIQGRPVQVFTGYLDDTPYFQMYPGAITLKATCTLKRLLFTYFDPALPYVRSFFNKYGWTPTNDGTLLNQSAQGNSSSVAQGKNLALQDASIAKLLWAVLTDIGDWKDSNIWIENLPSGDQGIAARMAQLMATIDAENQSSLSNLTTFLQQIIGGSSQGSGGGTGSVGATTSLSGNGVAQQTFNFFVSQGLSKEAAAGIVGNAAQESTYNPSDPGGGLLQWQGGRWAALAALAAKNGKPTTDLLTQLQYTWLELTNGPGAGEDDRATLAALRSATSAADAATQFMHLYERCLASACNLPHRIQAANDALATFGSSTPAGGAFASPNTVSSTAGASKQKIPAGHGGTGLTGAVQSGVQNVGTAVQSATTNLVPYFPLPQGTYVGPGSWTLDQGVDISAPGLTPLLAIGAGTIVKHGIGGFGPDAPVLKLDATIGGQQYVYYGHAGPNGRPPDGTHVTAGQQVASVGAGIVGKSTGPHLEVGFSDANGIPVSGTASLMLSTLKSAQAGQPVSGGGTPGAPGASAAGQQQSASKAEAFVATISLPSVLDMATAQMLGQVGKGFMHDQPLYPFITELAGASMRSFQSLPNGDFFAFYPDYFGETGHRKPYWSIDDIEILTGDIYLNDSSLVTHEYVVGDLYYPAVDSKTTILNLRDAGAITIFNAFADSSLLGRTDATHVSKNVSNVSGMSDLMTQAEGVAFIQRYGARPKVDQAPSVRSSIFEMLLAYQNFMQAWANQFRTTFTFTFMPELFPGGKVHFQSADLQMYIQSVTHTWDYTAGFQTEAVLTAPNVAPGTTNHPDLPPNMAQALVDPIRAAAAKAVNTTHGTSASGAALSGNTNAVTAPVTSASAAAVQAILKQLG